MAGGLLTRYLGWEYIFYLNVPIGAAALVLAPRIVPESRLATTRRRYDPFGTCPSRYRTDSQDHDVSAEALCATFHKPRKCVSTGGRVYLVIGGDRLVRDGAVTAELETGAERPVPDFGCTGLPS